MADKVQKVAILGGSFDPVTNAHLEIIRKLSKKFSRVVVLPCYISPFKQEGCNASGEERVKMLRKVTAELENVKVSKWEIKQEKISYSIDAVRHYKQKYEGAEIYFVIGSDCVSGLTEWKDADELAASATFLLIRRTGYAAPKKLLDSLKELGFKFKSAGFTVSDEASSLVRAATAFGKTAEFVPAEVAEYIEKHGLYKEYAPFVKAYKIFGLKDERIEHTFRAVKAGIRLAKIYGENVAEVITALILHDIGKYADGETLKKHKIKAERYDELSINAPAVLHAHVSAAIARDYFKCNERIVGAIEKHTTGAADMSEFDKIVYLADAIEEGRDYDGVESLRRVAAKDLNRAMLRSLKATVKALKQSKKPICEETLLACKRFAEICKAASAAKKAAPVFASVPVVQKKESENKVSKAEYDDLKNKGGKVLARFIAEKLSEKKGRDIVIIDVAQKTVLADCFVIAGAGSTTAVKAMADYVDEKLSKEHAMEPLRRDISPKWAVLDYGDVIVHIQHEEAREFYRLEKLWDNGDNVTPFTD